MTVLTIVVSIIIGTITLPYISYCIPVACLLSRGRSTLRTGPFWLQTLGLLCNWVLLAWTVFTVVV